MHRIGGEPPPQKKQFQFFFGNREFQHWRSRKPTNKKKGLALLNPRASKALNNLTLTLTDTKITLKLKATLYSMQLFQG
jgi:hypothetical protein